MKASLFVTTAVGGLLALALAMATGASSCDEACVKSKAEQALGKSFPSYLTWQSCDDTREQFMTSAMRSLQSYRDEHFDVRKKRGMANIKNFLDQRREWLAECDDYYRHTQRGRIFEDDATTDKVFAAIEGVSRELSDLINGVTYSIGTPGDDPNSVIMGRFDTLLNTVDDHRTLMHLKGRYVYR